jgi:oligopeptide transport system substrate-binding protein
MRQKIVPAILLCILAAFLATAGCQPRQTRPSASAGELRLWDVGPITLDPAVSSEMNSHIYVMQIFSGLVRLDANSKPAPDIAERWQRSEDGRTYTFFLRKGVKFHDGKEVTAHDFKYSWERACDPKTGSQTAATYLGDIVGARDVLEGKTRELSGVKVIDNYTLQVTIDAPKAYFLAKLTYPTAFVVDHANVKSGSKWWQRPNGTGPFKLKEWKQGELLVLERNENFYRQPPHLQTVTFRLLAGVPMQLYEMNQIDVAPVFEDYMERVTDESGPFYRELLVFPELSLFYISFNTRMTPFDDVNVRRAFCHAVDKDKIVRLILKGMALKASGILPPNIPGYNKEVKGLEYDPAKARGLIASSKYGNPENLPPVTLTISGSGGAIPAYVGAAIQDWQRHLGVEITVRQLEPEIFPYHIKYELDHMYFSGWIADYPDPQNFLELLFHSNAEYNYGRYSNSEVDAILDRAAIEQDDSVRFSLYQQAEKLIVAEAACLPLWFNQNYILVKPYVKNYKVDTQGVPLLSEVYIEHR